MAIKSNSLLFGQTALYSPLHLTFDLDSAKVQYRVFKRNSSVLLFTTVELDSVLKGKCFWPYKVNPWGACRGVLLRNFGSHINVSPSFMRNNCFHSTSNFLQFYFNLFTCFVNTNKENRKV